MTTRPLRRGAACSLGLSGLVLLAACSTGSTESAQEAAPAQGAAEADAFPVTVEHALGETTVEEEPERVVAVGYAEADFALSLGVVPVGATQILFGGNEDQSTRWFDAALAEIDGAEQPTRFDETDGIPIDEIVALEPDLVLATTSGITQEDYDKFEAAGIPAVAYPEAPYTTPWRESLDLIGDALGRPDRADEVADEVQATLDATTEEFPQLDGATFVFGGPNDADLSSFYVYTVEDNRPRMLTELGMEPTDFVTENSDPGAFLFEISAERATNLDADVFLTYGESEEQVQELAANPLIRQIPPIADGRWYASIDQSEALGMSAPSPLSIPDAMERYIPRVAAAVDGDGS